MDRGQLKQIMAKQQIANTQIIKSRMEASDLLRSAEFVVDNWIFEPEKFWFGSINYLANGLKATSNQDKQIALVIDYSCSFCKFRPTKNISTIDIYLFKRAVRETLGIDWFEQEGLK